jgi:hypothetical protein
MRIGSEWPNHKLPIAEKDHLEFHLIFGLWLLDEIMTGLLEIDVGILYNMQFRLRLAF